jgi:hypothetical protein
MIDVIGIGAIALAFTLYLALAQRPFGRPPRGSRHEVVLYDQHPRYRQAPTTWGPPSYIYDWAQETQEAKARALRRDGSYEVFHQRSRHEWADPDG